MTDWTPGDPLLPPGLWVRPLFEVIEDNPDLWWHGEARWPEPLPGHDIGWEVPQSDGSGYESASGAGAGTRSHREVSRPGESQSGNYGEVIS